MELRVELEQPPSSDRVERVSKALLDHYALELGDPQYVPLGLFLCDEVGEVQGGVVARLRWRWLYVEMLWVAEGLRGRGYGERLLEEAEAFARSRGGQAVHLEAGGSELVGFYVKRGYEVIGTMRGFPPGREQNFLRKWLVDGRKHRPSPDDASA